MLLISLICESLAEVLQSFSDPFNIHLLVVEADSSTLRSIPLSVRNSDMRFEPFALKGFKHAKKRKLFQVKCVRQSTIFIVSCENRRGLMCSACERVAWRV